MRDREPVGLDAPSRLRARGGLTLLLGLVACEPSAAERWAPSTVHSDSGTDHDSGQSCPGCAPPNASGVCIDGACSIGACNDGFANCDELVHTGCEVDLRSSPSDCGTCGNTCPKLDGEGACVDGACILRCNVGRGDCDGDVSNGCEVDLDGSPEHCGQCGRSCQGAGCTLGRCEAEWLTSEKTTNNAQACAAAVIIDDGYVYYGRGDGTLRRISTSGGESQLVVPSSAGFMGDFVVDETHVYVADVTGFRILRVAKDGTGPVDVVGTLTPGIVQVASLVYLAADADSVYWTNSVYSGQSGIRRVSKQGGSDQGWYLAEPASMTGIATHAGSVYWAEAHSSGSWVRRAKAASPNAVVDAEVAVAEAALGLSVDDSGVYFAVRGQEILPGGVYRWHPSSQELVHLAFNASVKWTATDAHDVFFRADDIGTLEGRLLKVDKQGASTWQTLLPSLGMGYDQLGGVRSVAVDETYVYLNQPCRQGILRVAK